MRFRGAEYPVIFPSWKDPRLHLSLTFVALHTIGQVEFHFRLSIPQILTALLTCGLIEFVYTFWQKRVLLWPASALLTGNGIAFIMRIPGTQHGDWWSTNGLWIYAAVGAVAMASKYLITWPRPARLQPVEPRARPLLPDPRERARGAAAVLVGPDLARRS